MARKPENPPTDRKREGLRREKERDPEDFRKKYGSDKPPPPTQDPQAPKRRN